MAKAEPAGMTKEELAREAVRNSDARLDLMLKAIRHATQYGTLDRQVLIAYLEKFMDKHCIRKPTLKSPLA